MSEALEKLYHLSYPLGQRLNLVGSWGLTERLHRQAIENAIIGTDPRVLYCGTATAHNPQDVESSLINQGYNPSLTVVDISPKPLEHVPKHMASVQASAAELPFDDNSFDIITTDFLFNVIDLGTIQSVAKEWARVLRSNGIITTTVCTTDSKTLLDSYQDKRFVHSEKALRMVLEAEGLQAIFTPFNFARKPLLYPSSPRHLVVRHNTGSVAEKTKKAKQLLGFAEDMSLITKTNNALAPRETAEIIAGVDTGSYEFHIDERGVLAFSGLQRLCDGWYELGPLFVRPDARNSGHASGLVQSALAKNEGANIVAFSDSEIASNIFAKKGFEEKSVHLLPSCVIVGIIADRVRTPIRMKAAARVALSGGKRVFVR